MEDELQNVEKSKRLNTKKKKKIQEKNETVADAHLARAVREKNLLYLSFFLHGYEHRLNAKVYSFLRRNSMDTYEPALFLDMKLAMQELILKKLPTYDPDRDTKFLTYIHQFIYDAFKAFRMQQEYWQIDSLDIYKGIRRMAAIYNSCGGDAREVVSRYCKETGCQRKTALRYLEQAIGIRARQTEVIVDWDENESEVIEDVVPDGMGDLCYVLWNAWMEDAVRKAMDKLPWRDRTILNARYAICNNCGGTLPWKEQYTYKEIMPLIGAGTEIGAEKACETALNRLIKQLAEDNAIRVLNYERIKLEPGEKKKAVAIYQYQADCDGEWGEIYFDFENKRIKIQRLAEWDTIRSHKYAWKVIGVVALNGDKVLQEKKRLIFWAGDIGQKKKRVLLQVGSVIYLPHPR